MPLARLHTINAEVLIWTAGIPPPWRTRPAGRTINGADVLYVGSGEVAEIAPADCLLVRGTALDEAAGGPASAAWLELDGRLDPATYCLPRGEVASARGQVWRDCGFEWTTLRRLRFRLGRRP